MSMHHQFVEQAIKNISKQSGMLGLAIGGSWITSEIDEYSDLDFVLVTEEKVSGDKNQMLQYASVFGELLEGFTGEHVGEPRVLICLFDNPLLHVDIKFVTLDEFKLRVENPVILWEKDGLLSKIITETNAEWPALDFQWIEDRFWIWVHYATLKIGRGEYFEALDFLSFIRVFVISPLLQIKNGQLPRGLRKVEFNFKPEDLSKLIETVPVYNPESIIQSLDKSIDNYLHLRAEVFPDSVLLKDKVKDRVMQYLDVIKAK